ncbi:MAG TPA: C39 family peptidase, partial [Candidatus Lokiarchaeia archaeon]|nr:C39 family peptidase [Candidatus Lokiarchaeia archaeon]
MPFYYQTTDYYCGDACLEMVFNYYGENISQKEIAKVARTVSPDGTWQDDMRRATHFSELSTSQGNDTPGNITGYTLRKYGYVAYEQQFSDARNVTQMIDAGYPVIILVYYNYPSNQYGHFRVVTGYIAAANGTIEDFIFNDPWCYSGPSFPYHGPGNEMNYSEFVACWAYSDNWSLFVHPWTYAVSAPASVEVNVPFTVSANLNNMVPFTNSSQGDLALLNATIQLPAGFALASGENLTKNFSAGTIISNQSTAINWQVVGTVPNAVGTFTVNASSLVSGTTEDHPDMPTLPGYNYTDLINGTGTSNSVVASNIAPVFTNSPPDISFVVGTTGHTISWIVHDLSVANPTYAVYCGGVEMENQSWTSDQGISFSADDLSVGNYLITLNVSDGFGGLVQDDVLVHVSPNTIPTIIGPADFSYLLGTTGHAISWTITDNTTENPYYVIYRNGTEIVARDWVEGSSISLSIDGLNPGTYNFTIIFCDGLGAIATDQVVVQVINPINTPFNPIPLVGIIAGGAVVTVIAIRHRSWKVNAKRRSTDENIT